MKKIIAAMALACLCLSAVGNIQAQTKKDGSKDMRYKKNKQVMKKDGTPDKRFKANKKY